MKTLIFTKVLLALIVSSNISLGYKIYVETNDKTWTFSTEATRRPTFYLDEFGNVAGFGADIVYAVCRQAEKNCRFVINPFQQCITSEEDGSFRPGDGLLEGKFDACPALSIAPDRFQYVKFTDPFLNTYSTFNVREGNPSNFDPKNIKGKTITHIEGGHSNAACLRRLGMDGANILVASSNEEAEENVRSGKADAYFTPRRRIPGFDLIPGLYECASGAGVMVMPDSTLPDWWNPAFQIIRESGEYREICEQSESRHGRPQRDCLPDENTWVFSTAGNRYPQFYIDEFGNVAGFSADLIYAVCREAGEKCEFQVNNYQQCATEGEDGEFRPGEGLREGKFDACPAWPISPDKQKYCSFTTPFLATKSFFTLKEGNPRNFDPKNLSGKTITYLRGFSENVDCLERLGLDLEGAEFVIGDGIDEVVDNVLSEKADALFSPRSTRIAGLEPLPESYDCSDGLAVMVMPDSSLPEWWNPAFEKLMDSGEYGELCEQSESRHGAPVRCLPYEKTWTFSTTGNRYPQFYIDEFGNVAGFNADLIYAVCREAGKKCGFQVNNYQQCATEGEDGEFRPGEGLREGKFDACPGWPISPDKQKYCSFTTPFLATKSFFTVKEGNPRNFDPKNLSGKTITYLRGFSNNPECLERLGMNLEGVQFLAGDGIDEVVDNVLSEKADALFSPRSTGIAGLEPLPETYECSDGVAVMVMPDSTLPEWWDPAFEKVMDSGEYGELCEQSESRHGASVRCLPYEKTWTFSSDGNRRPQFYIDEFGNVAGFNADLIYAVCRQAGKKCAIEVNSFQECINQDEDGDFRPGDGLVEGKFDACPGYVVSPDRQKYCNFSDPFLATSTYFTVKQGNPLNFDPTDLNGRTITYIKGFATNADCLARLGMEGAQYLIAEGINEAVENVQSEKADALFSPRNNIDELDALPERYDCGNGIAIMVMLDSSLLEWWNPAFQEVMDSGEYRELCEQSESRHGSSVQCFPYDSSKGMETKIVQEKVKEPLDSKTFDEMKAEIKEVLARTKSQDTLSVQEKASRLREAIRETLKISHMPYLKQKRYSLQLP